MDSPNRNRRLLTLVELFQTGRYYNATQLALHCNVTPRTVHRDIKTLQESGLRIIYDKQRQAYHLSGNYLLTTTDMTNEEAVSLIILCENLGRVNTGLPFSEPARSAVLKLHNTLPDKLKAYVTSLMEGTSIKIEALTLLEKSRKHFIFLQEALSEKYPVRIRYQSLSEQKEITTLLSVYRLLYCKHCWYAIGRSSIHREERTFNVSRILEITPVDKTYEIPPRFSVERYLGNAWQMIRGVPYDIPVTLLFSRKVANNVAEVRWHKTQQVSFLEDGKLEFKVTVDGLQELSWWVLGYGSEVDVVEPVELRTIIKTHAQEMINKYR